MGMKRFHFIKKRLACAAFFCIAAAGSPGDLNAQPHNGTEQLPNRGFELYDNEGSKDIEPQGWNSFMTAVAGNSILASGKSQRLTKENGGRPGTKGAYYLRLYSTEVLGIVANGNVTTGRINMGSTTATDKANYNYTDRENEGFFWRQTTVPDSLVAWLWFKPKESGEKAQVNVIIHNDNRTIDPGTERSQVVAQAKINPPATDGWQRFSVPFVKTGATNDARYVLASFTTNQTPGGGKANDELLVDDIFFVYNPTLRLNNFNTTAIGLRDGENVTVEVPFRITGTMSPQMGDDNIVIAELSDAAGSFANATEIGRLTTDESGSITAALPPTLPVGNGYRIRVRSTNYPRVSDDNGKDIELFRGYYIEGKASSPSRGSVSGSQTYKQGTQATLTAAATPGNHFSHWSENGSRLEGVGTTYTFTVDRNRTLTAHFDTNYYDFNLLTEGHGQVSVSPEPERGQFVHNTPVRLQATPDYGSRFAGFYDGSTLLNNQADYTFPVVRDLHLTARFELQQYSLTVTSNNAALGRVEGSGTYKFQSDATLRATPNPYCRFVAWLNAEGDTLSRDNPFAYRVEAAGRVTGLFAETFYRVTAAAQPAAGGNVTGGGSFSAQTPQKIDLTAEAKAGYTFSHWRIERADGEPDAANLSADNPLTLVSGRIATDYQCTAVFEPIRFQISATAEPEEGGNVTGDGLYEYQTQVRLTAIPAAGYRFSGWQDAVTGETLSAQTGFAFQATADRQLTAVFERERYDIAAKAEPAGYGRVDGGGAYAHGDEAVLKAQAADGYEFRYWYRGGQTADTAGKTAELTVPANGPQTYTAFFTIKRKQAIATAVPAQGGRIAGTGLYEHGATAVLQAQAADGYTFEGWRAPDGSPAGGTADVLPLKMDRDRTVEAVFKPRNCKVTLAVAGNRTEGEISFDNVTFGTTLSATLPYDSTLTLYARSKTDGYKVTNWLKQGGSASLGRTDQIRHTVKGDVRIEADFGTNLATVAVTVEPDGTAGTVTNAGNHPKGQYITLTAEAADGYHLARWQDEAGSETLDTNLKYTTKDPLTADLNLKAVFEKNLYTLSVAESEPAGAGTATLSTDGTNGARELTLAHGGTFMLQAQAAAGFRFAGWQTVGSDEIFSTEAIYEGVATQDAGFRAVFAPLSFELATRTAAAYKGRTRGDGHYGYGSHVTVTALPTAGHHLKEWRLSVAGSTDVATATENPYTFTLTGETTAEAVFDTNTYTLRFENRNPDLGSATMTIDGRTQDAGTSAAVIHNGKATFAANPKDEAHYRFAHFADRSGRKIGTANPWTVTVTSDTTVYAVFEPAMFAFSAESADPGMGAVTYTGGMEQPYLGPVTITAEPFYGYEFVEWVLADENGEPTETRFSTAVSTTFTTTRDTALRAVFKPKQFFVTCAAAIDGSGSVEGGDSLYTYGDEARVEAEPAYGYTFSHWEINGVRMSDETTYTWNVNEETRAVAVFTPVMFRIDLGLSPADLGYTTGSGLYDYGDTAVIKAVPNEGYYFRGWQNGRYVVSQENPYRLVVGRDSSFTAILATDTLTVAVQTVGEGEARGAGRFLLRENVTLEAVPADGHDFLTWTDENGERISNENPFVFPATESVTYTAVFLPKTYAVTLNTEAGGTLTGGGEYAYLSDVVLLAKADSVHTFRCWQLDELSAEDSLLNALFTPEILQRARLTYRVDRPLGLTAVFDAFTYDISAEASPANSGTFSGTGTFNHGASTVLEATPAEHFDFAAWTLNGETVSLEPKLEIPSIEEDRLYTALFKPTEYKIQVNVYPSKGGVATGAGSYRFGDTVQISVSMQPGYTLMDWTDNAFNIVSTDLTFIHIVKGSETFTATVKAANESERIGGNRLNVYPNPATDYLHFEAEADLRRITLFDARGRLLRQAEANGRQATLRTADCPSGLHFYRVEWQDGRVSHGKWIR